MFIQVIQGQCRDADRLHRLSDEWRDELGPGAEGWLGGTYGVTDDGQFVAVVRFDSREAAMKNSTRPEQGEWWAETSKLLSGQATFHDSEDVLVDLVGDPAEAGFVQVIQGRSSDPARARELAQATGSTRQRRRIHDLAKRIRHCSLGRP